MKSQKWRDVWEETRVAMQQLEESLHVVHDLERSVLIERGASICSEGVARTLELMMRDSVQQVRTRVHAAHTQLIAAVETLSAESTLEELKKNRSAN